MPRKCTRAPARPAARACSSPVSSATSKRSVWMRIMMVLAAGDRLEHGDFVARPDHGGACGVLLVDGELQAGRRAQGGAARCQRVEPVAGPDGSVQGLGLAPHAHVL